ncbi:MAG: type IV pilin protein [Bacillota bacterium]
MKEMLKKEAGFTLLELIVVVAVIGILAAIVVPQIGDIQGDAQLSSTKASLSSIQTALEQYKLDDDNNGKYPDELSDLNVDTTNYSYDVSDNNKHYIVAYDPESDDDSMDISDNGTISQGPNIDSGSQDELGDNNSGYYITSESSKITTTN